MLTPGAGEKPALVVGLMGSGDLGQASREAGAVAADTAPNGEAVNLMEVTRDGSGISSYMLESVEPFYQRTLGAKLRGIFSKDKG